MCEIPFLILYTLVENSIKHAMTLYEVLEIRVRCFRLETGDFRGICLVEEAPDLVVVGFDMTLTYEKLERACTFIRNGAVFLATHLDINCPTEDGIRCIWRTTGTICCTFPIAKRAGPA